MTQNALDLSHIVLGDHNTEEWETLMGARIPGMETHIDITVYDYFLDVLPPRFFKNDLFVFGEGYDMPTLFKKHSDARCTMQVFPDYPTLYNHLGIKVRIIG
jgi:hypothetical protein